MEVKKRKVYSRQKGEKELITEPHSSHTTGGDSPGTPSDLGCAHIFTCRLLCVRCPGPTGKAESGADSSRTAEPSFLSSVGTCPFRFPQEPWLPFLSFQGDRLMSELLGPQPHGLVSQPPLLTLAFSTLSFPRCLYWFWF